jgi:hypothetical protein
MSFIHLFTNGIGAVVLGVVTEVDAPGSECSPPSPASYYERSVRAMAPALKLKPDGPAAGDDLLRSLKKHRYASAFRRLELAVERVAVHQDKPDKLVSILRDLSESQMELFGETSDLIPVLEARVGLARLIEEVKKYEVEAGCAVEQNLEDARYARLDAEVELARARAGPNPLRRKSTTIARRGR